MTTIDFTRALNDAKGASFEALPVGDYDVEVAKTEAVTSSNGKPMVKTTFKVVSGPYEKRSVLSQFVLSVENPMAMAIFFRHMKAFGLTEEWFASLGQVASLEPVASALLGRRARLSVGHREWQGETRNEVKGVKPYTGAPAMTSPGAGPVGGPVPPGPAPLPPSPPLAGPTPPGASPLPVAPPPPPPQVQPMPQPPAPAPVAEVPAVVPTPVPSGGADVAPSSPPPAVTTSDVNGAVAASAPPEPPF